MNVVPKTGKILLAAATATLSSVGKANSCKGITFKYIKLAET